MTPTLPDATEVVQGLWIGRRPASDPFETFDVVVSLTEEPLEHRPPAGRLGVHLPMKDNGRIDDPETLRAVSDLVTALLEGGRTVLVHCSLGLSRSALFAALVIVERGNAPRDAVDHVRRARPGSLGAVGGGLWGKSGRAYAAWLLEEW
jgi:protein-tyrosine phosphatase